MPVMECTFGGAVDLDPSITLVDYEFSTSTCNGLTINSFSTTTQNYINVATDTPFIVDMPNVDLVMGFSAFLAVAVFIIWLIRRK